MFEPVREAIGKTIGKYIMDLYQYLGCYTNASGRLLDIIWGMFNFLVDGGHPIYIFHHCFGCPYYRNGRCTQPPLPDEYYC